jgi:hypothetical protein
MAIDPQRLAAFLADPNVPEDAKQRVRASTGNAPSESSQPTSESPRREGLLEAVGNTVKGRVGEIARPIQHFASNFGETFQNPTPRKVADLAGDVTNVGMNVGGTAAYWPATAAGAVAEVGGRMVGGESYGRAARTGTEIMTGPVLSAGRLMRAGSKEGLKRGAEDVLSTTGRGTTLEEGGQAVREGLKATVAARKAPLKPVFEQVLDTAKRNGVALTPGSAPYSQLTDVATQTADLLPNLAGPAKRVVQGVLTKAQKGLPIDYEEMERFHKMLRQISKNGDYLAVSNTGVTANGVRRLAGQVRKAQEDSLVGFPDMQQQFKDVRQAWKREVVPVQRMSNVAEKVSHASPMGEATGAEVMSRFKAGSMEDSTRLASVLKEIEPHQQDLVRSAVWNKFLAGKSPATLAKDWEVLGQTNPQLQGILRGKDAHGINSALKKIGSIAAHQAAADRNMIQRNMAAVITSGATGLALRFGTSTASDAVVPLGMLAAYGGYKGLTLAARAMSTPAGTKEAARLGMLIGKQVNEMYDRAAPAIQDLEETP